MKLKHTLIALSAAMVISGTAFAASQADYDKARGAAEAAVKAANKAGGEWRDSGKLLKQADEAAKAGDLAKALKLAKAAEEQGHLGKQQAMRQVNAGNPSYLYE